MPNFEPSWVGDVIRFWFEELGEQHWFHASDAVDAQIRARFLALHERLMADPDCGVAGPQPILAAVIVMDQFSRNIFRQDARAFAGDSVARRLSRTAIELRFDAALKKEERYFLYLPFEHSEDLEDQALSVHLIASLGNREWTDYALAHKALIDRFGRFPHRNRVLNRPATADEIESLKDSRNWGPMVPW